MIPVPAAPARNTSIAMGAANRAWTGVDEVYLSRAGAGNFTAYTMLAGFIQPSAPLVTNRAWTDTER